MNRQWSCPFIIPPAIAQPSSLAFLILLGFPMSRNAAIAFRKNASKPGVSNSSAAWPIMVTS